MGSRHDRGPCQVLMKGADRLNKAIQAVHAHTRSDIPGFEAVVSVARNDCKVAKDKLAEAGKQVLQVLHDSISSQLVAINEELSRNEFGDILGRADQIKTWKAFQTKIVPKLAGFDVKSWTIRSKALEPAPCFPRICPKHFSVTVSGSKKNV